MQTIEQLEDLLSEPPGYLIEAVGKLEGDILVLGAGGKMGPTLARMAKRASDAAGVKRRVVAVSLFFADDSEARLAAAGVETLRCDLLDPAQLDGVPEAENVVFMAGVKFGSTEQPSLTWAINACLPGLVCLRFRRSRIVVFSTGNVYGLSPTDKGGSLETDGLAPVGEYAWSALARERVFEYFSETLGIPVSIIRLNYACEMRYGVLVDIAQQVLAGEPISLDMGCFNVIWQGDACAAALAALGFASSPPFVLNVTGPEILRVRDVAKRFGFLLGKEVSFSGSEKADALLSNASKCRELLDPPRVTADQMISWTAEWLKRGGETLGKPTHFENREGKF